MDLKELESGVNPETHWYYQSKKIPLVAFVKKIFRQLGKPVMLVDVGSGSGFFMYELEKLIPEMISKIILVDIGYTEAEILQTSGKRIEKTRELPARIENAVVVMMDVLEHLRDDAVMLKAIREKSVGENFFFITVPAFMSLWSGHDVYLGHYRRYTMPSLKSGLNKAAYTYENIYFIYGWIFPLVWLKRKLSPNLKEANSDMKLAPSLVNAVLRGICSAEMTVRKWNQIAGVTLVAEGKI